MMIKVVTLFSHGLKMLKEKGCQVCNYSSVIFHAGEEREYPENY